jgi:hypothetical protein
MGGRRSSSTDDAASMSKTTQAATRRPMDPADYPLIIEVSEVLSRYGSDEHYEKVLSQMLAGIAADTQA